MNNSGNTSMSSSVSFEMSYDETNVAVLVKNTTTGGYYGDCRVVAYY